MQPESAIFALLWILTYFFISRKGLRVLQISQFHLIYLGVVVYSFAISCLLDSYNIRSIGNYLCLLLFSVFGMWVEKENRLFLLVLKTTAMITLLVGFLQLLGNSYLFDFLVVNTRTEGFRGSTGLAPEPSYYGISCLFMIFSFDMLTEKDKMQRLFFQALLFFQIIFLAKSFTALIGLVLWLASKVITSGKRGYLKLKIVAATSGILVSVYFALVSFSHSRLSYLLRIAYDDPFKMLIKDESARERLGHIVYSIVGFLKQLPFAIGHGTNSWSEFGLDQKNQFDWIINQGGNRIMSGYGAALFELGFVGLLIPISTLAILWNCGRNGRAVGLTLSLYLFIAVPLATPLLGTLLGIALSRRRASISS